MMMKAFGLIALSIASVPGAAALGDRLHVNFFAQSPMPLTQAAAEAEGWRKVNGYGPCDSTYGIRYRLGERLSPTMMYNHLGDVAGMTWVVDTEGPNAYPLYPNSGISTPEWQPATDEPGLWYLTVHFSDPSTMCAGAAKLQYNSVGDRLWARIKQTGSEPSAFYALPLSTKDINPSDGWVNGGCLPSNTFKHPDGRVSRNGMGQHWWRYFNKKKWHANDGYPYFLTYDQTGNILIFGVLTGGNDVLTYPTQSGKIDNSWADPAKVKTAELWSFPVQPLIPYFHTAVEMPDELVYLNMQDPSLPCGTVNSAIMHITFRAVDNVTMDACTFQDNLTVVTAEEVRESIGQPNYATAKPGHWSLSGQCGCIGFRCEGK